MMMNVIFYSVRKLRGSATQPSKSESTSKKTDKLGIAMASNQAYETMEGGGGGCGGGGRSQEELYEDMDTRYQVRGMAGKARVEALPYERVGVPRQAAGEDDIYEEPAV